jgi:hypothetical protein
MVIRVIIPQSIHRSIIVVHGEIKRGIDSETVNIPAVFPTGECTCKRFF